MPLGIEAAGNSPAAAVRPAGERMENAFGIVIDRLYVMAQGRDPRFADFLKVFKKLQRMQQFARCIHRWVSLPGTIQRFWLITIFAPIFLSEVPESFSTGLSFRQCPANVHHDLLGIQILIAKPLRLLSIRQ
jgi:hypothetical protein